MEAEDFSSWTDDIPPCADSGVGRAANEAYPRRVQAHASAARHFNLRHGRLGVYAVVDGFGGGAFAESAADFASKRLPAELLLGGGCIVDIANEDDDETVKKALKATFANVDKEYFLSMMENITARIVLREEQNKNNASKLAKLETLPFVGASVCLAVLLDERRVFVAGCGDARAVLCLKLPDSGQLKPIKLSVEHAAGGANEDEDLRLRHLGLDPEKAAEALKKAPTRCIGYLRGKGAYKEDAILSSATDDPVIPEPEIFGAIPLEPSFQFLLLFSKSLLDCLSGEEDPTLELCRLVNQQFAENATVSGVAQSVVDKLVRSHRERFELQKNKSMVRDDVTLLVRNFNAKFRGQHAATLTATSTTTASDATTATTAAPASVKELPVDENGRIEPYVDFGHFEEAFGKHQSQQSH